MRRVAEAMGAIAASMLIAAPAWAGCIPATPGPVIGLGIPALAAFGFAYHRLRNRNGR